MKTLVTGSAGHLGEALVRTLRAAGRPVVGIDTLASPWTDIVASICDRGAVREALHGCNGVLHTATLHKPHVATHNRQQFIDTNITGTLHLLEEALLQQARAFVCTSTTSTFGDALTPPRGAPAAWITEDVVPVPKNIYGATKTAAEDLCQLFHRNERLPCVVLRTSRFFPEADDLAERRHAFDDTNLKVNELLYRRVDIEDVVAAHLLALAKAPALGFGRYIVSATSPFTQQDLPLLATDAAAALRAHHPGYEAVYAPRGWKKMLPTLDRVYVNACARADLGWQPRWDFGHVLSRLAAGLEPRSELALTIGAKGYHRSAQGA